ncbi:hypothetical protein Cni_G11030 [Canna indica]|uniref:Uncharacterized protein n=1 Tax=Canna indica TaxID=4628 RepID=A0AAQ3QBA1_9LILI|nr:hypothetical protein Cni_G11030 [Canna indica]
MLRKQNFDLSKCLSQDSISYLSIYAISKSDASKYLDRYSHPCKDNQGTSNKDPSWFLASKEKYTIKTTSVIYNSKQNASIQTYAKCSFHSYKQTFQVTNHETKIFGLIGKGYCQ